MISLSDGDPPRQRLRASVRVDKRQGKRRLAVNGIAPHPPDRCFHEQILSLSP